MTNRNSSDREILYDAISGIRSAMKELLPEIDIARRRHEYESIDRLQAVLELLEHVVFEIERRAA